MLTVGGWIPEETSEENFPPPLPLAAFAKRVCGVTMIWSTTIGPLPVGAARHVTVADSPQMYTPVGAPSVSRIMASAIPRDALDTFADRQDTIRWALGGHSGAFPQDLGEELQNCLPAILPPTASLLSLPYPGDAVDAAQLRPPPQFPGRLAGGFLTILGLRFRKFTFRRSLRALLVPLFHLLACRKWIGSHVDLGLDANVLVSFLSFKTRTHQASVVSHVETCRCQLIEIIDVQLNQSLAKAPCLERLTGYFLLITNERSRSST